MPKTNIRFSLLIPVLVVLISVYIGVLGFQRNDLIKENDALNRELAGTKNELASTAERLNAEILSLQNERFNLHIELDAQANIVDSLSAQVGNISGAVSTLTKLSLTDKELLKKYSKIYFLNENYFPKKLVPISQQYVFDLKRLEQVLDGVWPHLEQLLNDATSAGIEIKVSSSYRSFETQVGLKSAYKVTYGSGANAFSSDQGYSEHQLGTTVDFTNLKVGSVFSDSTFEKSAAFQWLKDNAYKYGFELSYPDNNSYYIYEPWHWRFVGRALAKKIHDENINFYELDQRGIDTYLVSFFD
ncbi:MAG: M15 family metallopeptidase [Candidatus Azambacteria bacterium]|nr:M15 family metallopeptidase [Candidatus Azambacteria bacterium]